MRVVTIAEVCHYSKTSHEFHFKLLKRLHAGGRFTCFSSERLGVIDAVLMNAWLEGALGDMSLDELFTTLPFGGLGTYRWMQYFKETGLPYRLLGLAPDFLDLQDQHAARLANALSRVCTVVSPDGPVRLKGAPTTPRDHEVQRGIALAKKTVWSSFPSFRDAWLREIKRALHAHGHLFINGYHLARGGTLNIGQHIAAGYKPLYFGMGAPLQDRHLFSVDAEWLTTHGIKPHEFAASAPVAQKAWRQVCANAQDYMAAYRKSKHGTAVIAPSRPRAYELVKVVPGFADPAFNTWGAEPYPVLAGSPGFDDGDLRPSMFDFIAFVPRSHRARNFYK